MSVRILIGDCRERLADLEDESVNCCVTSPPYFGLRDYGHDGQIGLESTPADFVAELVDVFREARRVLRDDGTLWLNLGDSYAATSKGTSGMNSIQPSNAGSFYSAKFDLDRMKPKDLIGVPWSAALALRDDGWYLRSDIIWHKPNPMPESVTDRPTKAHEYIFLLSKSPKYHFDADAVKEDTDRRTWHDVTGSPRNGIPGQTKQDGHGRRHAGFNERYFSGDPPTKRNIRDVWTIPTQGFPEAHFATFPPKLIEPCIKAGCPKGGIVLDPFGGAGTTGLVADRLERDAILVELNPEYAEMARKRIYDECPMFAKVTTE
jgi:DNA modification methylase